MGCCAPCERRRKGNWVADSPFAVFCLLWLLIRFLPYPLLVLLFACRCCRSARTSPASASAVGAAGAGAGASTATGDEGDVQGERCCLASCACARTLLHSLTHPPTHNHTLPLAATCFINPSPPRPCHLQGAWPCSLLLDTMSHNHTCASLKPFRPSNTNIDRHQHARLLPLALCHRFGFACGCDNWSSLLLMWSSA